jgi:hypothetical protein
VTQPKPSITVPLSQLQLVDRHSELRQTHERTLSKVEALVREQQQVSTHLSQGLSEMQSKGAQLDQVGSETGLVARITRLLSRRSEVLARRSISEALVGIHEKSVVDLRRASTVTDHLKRTAAELNLEAEGLHQERVQARQMLKETAQRVLKLEAELDLLQANRAVDHSQEIDSLEFEERSVSGDVLLIRAHIELCTDELAEAQELRDTVQTMHEDMARFVLGATKAVNGAGRRIQSLGMAADAATVVIELNESMLQLDVAMQETSRYLLAADDLLTRVLPGMNAKLSSQEDKQRFSVQTDLEQISRSRARAMADQALLEAAEAEVDGLWVEG